MSQMQSAPRPASRSPTAGRNPLPPVQHRDDGQQSGGTAEGRGLQQELERPTTMRPTQPTETLQSVPVSQATTSGEDQRISGSSRGLGVHTILNPPESEASGSSTPQLNTSTTRSPQPSSQTPQYTANPPPYSQGYVGQQQTGISPPAVETQGASSGGRKYASLKSARAVSLGGRPAATKDARQSPFLTSAVGVYTAEPGTGPLSEVPPMPMPVGASQQPYGFPPNARRPSMAAPSRAPLSQSTSPSPSLISSYSQPSQPSPAAVHQLGQTSNAPYFPGPSFGAPSQQREGTPQAGPPVTEGPYMAPVPETVFRHSSQSGGQNPNIRFMPISTEHGQMYLPVDVQAASKMADEKRARNAGASARFRERRKQKEKEASMNIQKLEHQLRELERRLRDAEHDRDFYRSERDRFREFCYRNPSTRELVSQAPMSPRLSRPAAFPPPPAGSMYQAPESGTIQEAERPAQRRRTGDYVFNAPAPSFPSYQGPSYRTSPGPGASQPPTTLPPLRMPNVSIATTAGAAAPSNTPQPTTHPPSFEQYPRSGYDRGWQGDGGGGQQ